MGPTHLSVAEVDLLTMLMSICHDGPLSDTGARLQRLIDRHTAVIECGATFPYAGTRIRCNQSINHAGRQHFWIHEQAEWRVFWDDTK